MRILVIDPARLRRALTARAIRRVSERITIDEAADATALPDASSAPDVVVAHDATTDALHSALARWGQEIPVLEVSADGRTSNAPAGAVFDRLREEDLAASFDDAGSAARLAQAIRRGAWCRALQRAASPAARAHADAALRDRLRVLHVDDSQAALAFARVVLKGAEIDLVQRESGGAGLEAAAADAFDAALVDSLLADADGVDLARAIALRSPATAVIGLTSSTALDVERAFFRAGAWAYLLKGEAATARLAPTIRQAVRMNRLWQAVAHEEGGDARRPDLTGLPDG